MAVAAGCRWLNSPHGHTWSSPARWVPHADGDRDAAGAVDDARDPTVFGRPDASPRDLVIDAALRVARDHAPDTPTDPPAVGVVTEINPRFFPHDAVLHRVPDGRDDSLPSTATVRHTLQTLVNYGWLQTHAPGVLKAVDWRTAGTE